MSRSPMSKSVDAVVREAERWGVVVKFGAKRTNPSFQRDVHAPTHDGYVDDAKRIVYVCGTREEFERLPQAAPALMHEVNHAVLGCHAAEEAAMFALDHEAYRRLRLVGWSTWMESYECDFGTWNDLPTHSRAARLRKAYACAEKEKALVNGRPNYEGARSAHAENSP